MISAASQKRRLALLHRKTDATLTINAELLRRSSTMNAACTWLTCDRQAVEGNFVCKEHLAEVLTGKRPFSLRLLEVATQLGYNVGGAGLLWAIGEFWKAAIPHIGQHGVLSRLYNLDDDGPVSDEQALAAVDDFFSEHEFAIEQDDRWRDLPAMFLAFYVKGLVGAGS